jgi:hypothetical protein
MGDILLKELRNSAPFSRLSSESPRMGETFLFLNIVIGDVSLSVPSLANSSSKSSS